MIKLLCLLDRSVIEIVKLYVPFWIENYYYDNIHVNSKGRIYCTEKFCKEVKFKKWIKSKISLSTIIPFNKSLDKQNTT